jgi:uncharacterized protein (TIGR00369 family)
MEMAVTPRVVNSSGALQGGLLATLIDMVAGMSLLHGDGAYLRSSTSEMQISFLDGARVGPVRAVARVLRRGRRSAVVRVDVHDIGAGDLYVAAATLTFAVKTGESGGGRGGGGGGGGGAGGGASSSGGVGSGVSEA